MAELTIQVPDELARRLEALQDRLPELLNWLADTIPPSPSSAGSLAGVANLKDAPPVYAEVIDFLINRPTLQEIAAFKVSPSAQARLRDLLDKNRESALSEPEIAELDLYEQIEQMMISLKARACDLIGQ